MSGKTTDGKATIREGWRDQHARFTAEEIAEAGLATSLRRDAGSYYMLVRHMDSRHSTPSQSWAWSLHMDGVAYRLRSGMARTAAEAQRKADAAYESARKVRARRSR